MSNWQTKRFDKVADIGNGQVDPKKEPYCNFMHIGPENVESGTGRILNPEIAKDLGLISGKYEFDEKSIVYSKIRPNLNKLCTPNFSGLCSADMYPIWSKEFISKSYLYYFMQSPMFVNEAVKCSMRTGLPKINRQDLNHIKINFPTSLDVQKGIVDILEKWDTTIEKTEALIDAKERQFGCLQKSALDDDFKSYSSHLSNYAGIMKQQKIEEVGDLKPLTVKLHCKGIEANERDMQIMLSKKGRPYFQRFAGEFLIGRQNFHNGGFGIVPEQLDGFIASSAITTLEIDEAKIDPKYLFHFFSRKEYYLRIGHIMDGTGQKELSDKQIMKLPVSIPSIEKQKEVVALLNTAQKEITLLKKLAEQYRTQKCGLMQKLLSGQWHVKNKETAQ